MMIGGSRNKASMAQKYVEDKRRVENNVNYLGAFLKNDQIARHIANWEVNGKQMQKNQFQKQRIEDLRRGMEMQTNSRREKLKNLYDYEEEMYNRELRGLRQTPEQVKATMTAKVEELKSRREQQRVKEVEEKLDRRFKEQADELRLVESKIKEQKTKHEQDIQMLEKQKKMEEQYADEMIYAELWRRDMENKKRAEEIKIQQAIKKNNDRNAILHQQTYDLDLKKRAEENLLMDERAMLKQQWAEEQRRQREQELEELRVNKQLNNEIHTHNIEQKRIRKIEEDKVKVEDKKMVDDIVFKEKMLDQLERERRDQYRQETKDFLLNFKNRSNELKLNQDHIDMLLNDEMERQWKKRQDQWDKEQDARIRLMTDVYENRADAVSYKKNLKEDHERRKELEKQLLTQELSDLKKQEARNELEEYLVRQS